MTFALFHRLAVIFGQNCPMQQSQGLFAIAKLLVVIPINHIVES